MPKVSDYYTKRPRIARIGSKLSLRARERVYSDFINIMKPHQNTKIVDVGVTCDETNQEGNFLEIHYPWPENLMAAGVEGQSSFLGKRNIAYVRIVSHKPLPFPDKHFDIGYSNAVLEHVGSRLKQRAFLREVCRISKRIFVVVPNRLFPIEHHTGLPLLHYLPNNIFRWFLQVIGQEFYSKEENLNLFFPREYLSMFPSDIGVKIKFSGVGIGLLSSNISAFTQ